VRLTEGSSGNRPIFETAKKRRHWFVELRLDNGTRMGGGERAHCVERAVEFVAIFSRKQVGRGASA
jgi:hypothetical protein